MKNIVITALAILLLPSTNFSQENWEKTVENAKHSILMLEVEFLTGLENDDSGCYQATGFIVDEKNGIILTNRHVIGSGPTTARATFWNREKIEIKPVYYDPVHDFGFYKFNPKDLKWAKAKAIRLGDSSKVKVGEEIRVLGNNASEGFSIIGGTVSWVNKNAPIYSDPDTYRDSNTYYFQTSADVTGGSSGGPIINKAGEALAINSSSKNYTTVSWGLPINMVKDALKATVQGKKVKRGDIGARITFSPFNEILEYGFPKELVDELKRKKDIVGLLTVSETLRSTDAYRYLKPGDVIWQIDGEKIRESFERYQDILNKKTGKKVSLTVVRESKKMDFAVTVLDLESLKTNSFVRIGFDYFSNIPLFLAYTYNLPTTGVYTQSIRYNFSEREDFPGFLLLTELGGTPLKAPEDFYRMLKGFKEGDEVKIRYKILKQQQREEEKVFKINWKWFKAEYFKLNEKNHEWVKEN